MAKSLRSHAKKSFRAAKRSREDSDYHIKDAARLARLNARLTGTAPKPEATRDNRSEFADDVLHNESNEDDKMGEEKKVSTSGRDKSRHSKSQSKKKGAGFKGSKRGKR